MKKLLYLIIGIITGMLCFVACEEADGGETGSTKDGLTKDIHNIVSDDVLQKIKDLGVPIYGGDNPPNVEGTYLCSPTIWMRSNFSDFVNTSTKFGDVEFTFSKQNNSNHTIFLDYFQPPSEQGKGLGAFIVGEGNKFTVFVELKGTLQGLPITSVQVYSGEWTSAGIKDFKYTAVCTVPNQYSLKKGEGRSFKDGDGLAERMNGNNGGGNTGGGNTGGGGGSTTNKGTITVWTDKDHGCGYITVTITGVGSKTLTNYYSSGTPDCGDNGTASFPDLPYGTYTVSATCGNSSWPASNITLSTGCHRVKLN